MCLSNIIVAFPKIEDGKSIKNILIRGGYTVAGICTSGINAISLADNLGDGVIICGYKLTDMVYSELNKNLSEGFELILVVSKMRWPECIGNDIVCLSMPLNPRDLNNTVEMTLANIAQKKKKKKQEPRGRTQEEHTVIEQAKEVLMDKNNMTESEAHRYIQKNSMNSGKNMVEYAKMVLKIMYR